MAVFVGQFLLTAPLLNRVAAPLIRRHYPFIKGLSFRVADDFIIAEIVGRYSLFSFKGLVAVHLLEFIFQPSRYHISLKLSMEMEPRFLRPLLTAYLKRTISRIPGLNWSGDRLSLDLEEFPFFARIRGTPVWGELLSGLRISHGKQDVRGLPFDLYLHELHRYDRDRYSGKE